MENINKPEIPPDLEKLREGINESDKEMIGALAKRMKLIPLVAEYKKLKNLPRYQPQREKEVIESRRRIALEFGLSPELVEKIMELIIEDAHRIEREIMGE